MILLFMVVFCMSMVFCERKELFLENKDNYHLLIRNFRPNWRRQQRAQTEKMRQEI